MSNLAERAILVHFTAPMWEPKAQDNSIAQAIEQNTGASAKTLKVYKTILRSDSLKALRSIRTDTYANVHCKMTLPWVHRGPAILPIDLFETYRERMDNARDRETFLREKFWSEYPILVERARDDLGTLYDSTLYPTLDELKEKFSFKYYAQPIAGPSDFRISDPSLKEGYELVLEGAQLNAHKEATARLGEAITHMAERLSLYEPPAEGQRAKHPFHASMVENLKEVVRLMPALNLTNDARLAEMAKRAEENLTYHDADSLRESDSIRRSVLDEAKAILADLQGWR